MRRAITGRAGTSASAAAAAAAALTRCFTPLVAASAVAMVCAGAGGRKRQS